MGYGKIEERRKYCCERSTTWITESSLNPRGILSSKAKLSSDWPNSSKRTATNGSSYTKIEHYPKWPFASECSPTKQPERSFLKRYNLHGSNSNLTSNSWANLQSDSSIPFADTFRMTYQWRKLLELTRLPNNQFRHLKVKIFQFLNQQVFTVSQQSTPSQNHEQPPAPLSTIDPNPTHSFNRNVNGFFILLCILIFQTISNLKKKIKKNYCHCPTSNILSEHSTIKHLSIQYWNKAANSNCKIILY